VVVIGKGIEQHVNTEFHAKMEKPAIGVVSLLYGRHGDNGRVKVLCLFT
jgi:hypothetical protein